LIPVDSPPWLSYPSLSTIDRPGVHELECHRKGMEFPITACRADNSYRRRSRGQSGFSM